MGASSGGSAWLEGFLTVSGVDESFSKVAIQCLTGSEQAVLVGAAVIDVSHRV